LGHGALEDAGQPVFVDFPEIALDSIDKYHGDFLGVALTQLRQPVRLLFRPPKSQRGSNPSDGVARPCAQVTVCFGDEDYVGFCHALTVSPFDSGGGADGGARADADIGASSGFAGD
jgi:hypothetical protein